VNWLYNYSDIFILIFFVTTTLIIMEIIHAIFHRYVQNTIPKEGYGLAAHLHESIIILISLVLTFSLAQVIDDTHTLEKMISNEATKINNLDRLLTRYGDPKAEAIRTSLHAYTKSIVEDEWPELLKGHGSDKTRDLFKPISQGVIRLQPHGDREQALYSSGLTLIDDLAQARENRIETTEVQLPNVYWIVILLVFFAKFVVSALLERGKLSSLVLSMQMVALSAMLSLVFIFDQPYLGESGVKPGPIKKLIKIMDERHSELDSAPQKFSFVSIVSKGLS